MSCGAFHPVLLISGGPRPDFKGKDRMALKRNGMAENEEAAPLLDWDGPEISEKEVQQKKRLVLQAHLGMALVAVVFGLWNILAQVGEDMSCKCVRKIDQSRFSMVD